MSEIGRYSGVREHYIHWILATATAAVMMLAYVHQFVYPRTEGEKLEKRVEQIDSDRKNDMSAINFKIDKIYEILLELRRRS